MTRPFISVLLLLALSLGVGCASKKPTAAGAGGGASTGTEGGVTESPGGGGGAGGAGESLDASAPTVYFEFNSYTIDASERDKLQKAADALKAKESAQVTIEGHCDERGSNEYNLALGERRALAVKSYLQKLGIEGKRLATISYGEEKPSDSSHTESAWSKNRRGEIIVNR